MMVEKYLRDGQIDSAAIAKDVQMRKLNEKDIRMLCADKRVQETFIGDRYTNKQPKQNWNKEYLDKLYYAVVAESFNLDYLLYLSEVADFVSKAKFKKIVIAGIIIVLVIIAGVVVFSYTFAQGRS